MRGGPGGTPAGWSQALDELRRAAEAGGNLMDASHRAARAGVTTGEWAGALRAVFGGSRAPTGLAGSPRRHPAAGLVGGREPRRRGRRGGSACGRVRLLVAKPGLDGHSNAAEQIAVRARDAGFEVIYQGIRLGPSRDRAGRGRRGRPRGRPVDPVRRP